MAVRGKMGSADNPHIPYNKPNPPKAGMGSVGGGLKPNPPNPPKTGIGSADSKNKTRPGMIGNPKVPQYKKGGRVRKTGVALVHKGEYVVPAKGRKQHGRKKMAKR